MGAPTAAGRRRLRRLARVDLLILDDFAMRAFTASQGDDFYELVSERAGHGSFILTANRSPKDWYELFPNAVVAESVPRPAREQLLPRAHGGQKLPA